MPSALDPALLRPGRIDRMYYVGFPNLEGRIKTFNGYLNKVRHDVTDEQVKRLAIISPRISGAGVKDIVNESVIASMRRGREVVTWPDVVEARVLKVHGVPEGLASTRLEQWEVALHEASHAVAMHRFVKHDVIDIATIDKRPGALGFVSPVPIEDRNGGWKSEREDRVMTYLASRAGERIFFGENSSGVSADLASATGIVTEMLYRVGMGDTIAVTEGKGDKRRDQTDATVEATLQALYERVRAMLEEERWLVLAVAHALVSRATITGEDIEAIDNGVPGILLDGAWYHDAGNRRRLEEFHARARAHHEAKIPYFVTEPPTLPSIGLPPPPPPAGPEMWDYAR